MTQNLRPSLDRILESAVILSWADLFHGHRSGSIHLEYAFGPDGSISTLKLWLSTVGGRWRLVCGVETEIDKCIQLEEWCTSAGLASNLEFILRHQTAFVPPRNYGRAGLLQIKSPTQDEIDTAVVAMNAARADSISKQPAIA